MMRHCRGLRHVTTATGILAATLLAALTLAAGPGRAEASLNAADGHHKAPAGKHHPAAKSHRGWVKYYIVQRPHNGKQQFLYEIAQHTLGSGQFATMIFDLNKGRLEPGDQHLVSPALIRPGWILVLPASARGSGVHYGPLPVVAYVSPSATPSETPAAQTPSAGATPPAHRPRASTRHQGRGDKASADLLLKAALAGALIMLLLTGGLLLFAWRLRHASRPQRTSPPPAGPAATRLAKARPAKRRPAKADRARPFGQRTAGPAAPPTTASSPPWLAGSALNAPDPQSALTLPPLALGQGTARDEIVAAAMPPELTSGDPAAAPAIPGWLGAPPTASLPMNSATASDDEAAWPDYLGRAGGADDFASAADSRYDDAQPLDPPAVELPPPSQVPSSQAALSQGAPGQSEPDTGRPGDSAGPEDLGEADDLAFSPAALRVLGARPRESGDDDMPPQRHEVALGDDLIEVVLAQAPAPSQSARSRGGKTWLAATPYLLWTPLPYDVPDDGLAFACVGAGDEGCLFIDIGAAPGAIEISGDQEAAVRLAESIIHQLCVQARDDRAINVILVGDAIGEPHPPGATWVPTLRDLAGVSLDRPPDGMDVVCCAFRSSQDAFVLARHVGSAERRIVPLVLGRLPGAAWSFTAQPSFRLEHALPSLAVSPAAGSA
jgi:hypothetical protein